MAAAKRGDDGTVEAAIREMEIPNPEQWFVSTFGEERGRSWAQPYAKDLRKNEKKLEQLFEQHAQNDGEISATKVADYAKPGSFEWGLSHGLKRPADFYLAEFRASETPKDEGSDFIGYFVFISGKFRWDSTIQVVKLLPISTTGVQSFRAKSNLSADQSASGTVYMSELSESSISVPQDWRTDHALARAKFGVGAFTSPDHTVTLLIQRIPTAMSPADFVREFDAQGNRLFVGYRKISDSPMTVDGKDCQALEFQFADTRYVADRLHVPVPLQSWTVVIPVQRGLLVFDFVTSSLLMDPERPILGKVVRSYHSLRR